METSYTSFTDFLSDNSFIKWQLVPDETSDLYWNNFIRENPHLEAEMQRASEYLKTIGLNKCHLNNEDRNQLLANIRKSIEQDRRKKRINRFVRYSVTACVAIVLIFVGLNTYFSSNESPATEKGEEFIVGNLLNSEDIQLIIGKESVHFENDIQMQIDEKGTAVITQNRTDKEEKINIAHSTLNKLVVPYGKRSSLTLSDGSKVWLNSGSVLEFPAQFRGNNREIRLASGEMYIEVAPDKKKSFYVHTSDFNVKVYGTKFNISGYSGSPQSVVLVEGRVSLLPTNNKEIFLSPNEQAIYSADGTFSTRKVDVNQYISWKNGYLAFDKTPMTEVLKQIGRYYNLSFDYDKDVNLQKRTCTGKIYLSKNLDNVMTTVGLLSSTKYVKNNNQIYIINEPD